MHRDQQRRDALHLSSGQSRVPSPSRAVLRQRESYPESQLPPGVQPLPRPSALGRAVELAFLRWERCRLAPVECFWRDFGLHIVSASSERVVARGAGAAPCVAIAERGPRNRFVGPAFRMSEDTDLERYVDQLGAHWLAPESIPGGGRGIELFDPSGRSVWLLQGQRQVECAAVARPSRVDHQHGATGAARQPHGARADRAGTRRAAGSRGSADG